MTLRGASRHHLCLSSFWLADAVWCIMGYTEAWWEVILLCCYYSPCDTAPPATLTNMLFFRQQLGVSAEKYLADDSAAGSLIGSRRQDKAPRLFPANYSLWIHLWKVKATSLTFPTPAQPLAGGGPSYYRTLIISIWLMRAYFHPAPRRTCLYCCISSLG